MTDAVVVSEVNIYPVKSCRGIALSAAQLDEWGLQYDRNWMVVTPDGRFLSQREVPQLARVETALEPDALRLSAPGLQPLRLPLHDRGTVSVDVTVWGDRCRAIDQGDDAAGWFRQAIDLDCRLVHIGADHARPVAKVETAQVGFADAFPLLLISEASLADLNRRLPEAIPMNRFRPNLVVTGCAAYAEDGWQQIQIGDTRFEVAKPCERCVITTTDQITGVRPSKEPLVTLARYRKVPGGVIFGQNLVHRGRGEVRVGDRVYVL